MKVAELSRGIKHKSPSLFFETSTSPVIGGLCAGSLQPDILTISDEQVVNIRQDTNNLDKSLEKKLDYSGT